MTALRFSADPADLDRDLVHRWMSEDTYWARGRSRETNDAAIDGSRPFGIYDAESGAQLGYARLVTDGATFAWLADVFVSPDARGDGIGKALVEGILAEIEPWRLKRILLFTSTAHTLYARYGFRPIEGADDWMWLPGSGYRADVPV
jgi:GNAT superfamily N-acetyltransferase